MVWRICGAVTLAVLPAMSAGAGAVDTFTDLAPGHPRLILTDGQLSALRETIDHSPEAEKLYRRVLRNSDKLLEEPAVKYLIPDGKRLLAQSRKCVDRIYTLGLAWRMTGDEKYARRAFKELKAAAEFPDWNPSHYLDTAEMSHAFGIGYDWLYGWMDPGQRKVVREALVGHGLRSFLSAVRGGEWWTKTENNWGQVCYGGSGIGALALADEKPEMCAEVVEACFGGLVHPMGEYAPDGGIAEGPGYWHYATRYAVHFFAAARTALGTDRGLSALPGFAEAGRFRIHYVGPLGRSFNFADAHERVGEADEMLWLAERFGRPEYARHAFAPWGWPTPLRLIWGAGYLSRRDPRPADPPEDAFFRGVDVVFMRSGWDDSEALYVGFKGGDNAASHGHLDLGTFVFDALGERWVVDLGPDDYNMPAYFGGKRWTYYRLTTEGHNAAVIGGRSQNVKAKAPIVAFHSSGRRSHAVADLTAAWTPAVRRVLRGIALVDRKAVLIQDEFDLAGESRIDWYLHTRASVKVDGARATLTIGKKKLTADILSPAGAEFTTATASVPPPQNPNEGVTRLAITVPRAKGSTRIAVVLNPGAGDRYRPRLEKLSGWRGRVR